eukprot:CAMPEP_0197031694 /NCGR_PEP_ID=MMETSP1384-20130603/10617_1 /TAXON_ID=29189 /ORGANISM="Ammonia sp." /LENGTH=565 /DNA_ID=CAMNT_0042461259 /DNA_START=25 /DNA_END=1722 /DNA_ORIENTATION=+
MAANDTNYEPLDDSNYDVMPSPRLSDLPSDLQDVNLEDTSNPVTPLNHDIEMRISSPPRQPVPAHDEPTSTASPSLSLSQPNKKKKRRKSRSPYINMRLRNMCKLFDREQIYFGSIAPLRDDHIDLHCAELKDLELHYCCGLFMKIDRSFTIHTILSTEFITSLKKNILKREQLNQAYLREHNLKNVELKVNEASPANDDESSPSKYVAFHPRDHWDFAKDMEHKNAVIFVHGQNYAPDEPNAAQFVMDECMAFYADMPYLVIPFIWPCEGELLDYDVNIIAEEYCGAELANFIRRMWVLFERIDFVGHGKGCNILMRAIKLLKKQKPDVIDMSHVVLIAADMDSTVFFEDYLEEIYRFVQRITVYVNTWDWKLFSSKLWNWSSQRVGAMLFDKESKVDCIDVTQLLSGWFMTSNHYYLTNKYFKLDVIQALSKVGGVDPKYRNYVLPVYDDAYGASLLQGESNIKYYELVDKPYMKIVPDKKQNQRAAVDMKEEEEEEDLALSPNEGDTKQPEQEEVITEEDMSTITKNLQTLGYVEDDASKHSHNPESPNSNDVQLQMEDVVR